MISYPSFVAPPVGSAYRISYKKEYALDTSSDKQSVDRFLDLDQQSKDDIACALWADTLSESELSSEVLSLVQSEKNSNKARGQRMRSFLHYLIENPLSRTPDYTAVYRRLLKDIDEVSASQEYAIALAFLGPGAALGYEKIEAPANFVFPKDHEPKMRSKIGWHFLVGSCWSKDGREFGVELMFFRSAIYPPAVAARMGLSDLENQTVELQLAISEAGKHHYQAEPIVLSGTSGLVSFEGEPYTYRLGKNKMQGVAGNELFPLKVEARGVDRGFASPVGIGVDITLDDAGRLLLQGDKGCAPAVGGIGTYYYSFTSIGLDPSSSTLMIGDEVVELEKGLFWFDHQWGALSGVSDEEVLRASVGSKPAEPSGWDWFMAQFGGNRQITVYATHKNEFRKFYEQTGPDKPETMSVAVVGTYMDEQGAQRMVRGTLEISDWIKDTHSPNPRRYLLTGTWYPNAWHFTFGTDVPPDIASFSMTPIVAEAQSGFFASSAEYAEGAVILKNDAGIEIGCGFAESVSYADNRKTACLLSGLKDDDETINALKAPELSGFSKLRNVFYILRHKKELEKLIEESAGLDII